MNKLKGKAWVFGDNLDVDYEIIPYMKIRGKPVDELGQYCMTMVDSDFPTRVKKGDFIVAGSNMGCGHDHIYGPQAIKKCGIAAVIAKSFNRFFFRNLTHLGLPAIQCKDIRKKVKQGDELEISLKNGKIKNIETGDVLNFTPIPHFLLDIINEGGLYPYLKKKIEEAELL